MTQITDTPTTSEQEAPQAAAPAKKKATPTRKASKAKKAAQKPRTVTHRATAAPPEEDLVVFAFRLTLEERKAIHKAAGPGKASKFVRALATYAARGDRPAILKMLQEIG